MIVIVDYGVGNVGSIRNMLKKVGEQATISSDPVDVQADILFVKDNQNNARFSGQVRASPSFLARVTAVLAYGDRVVARQESGAWTRVGLPGRADG